MFKIYGKTVRRSASVFAIIVALSPSAIPASAADRTYSIHIPAENTALALNDFSRQAGVQILFPYDLAAAHQAPAISGQYTRDAVLKLLLAGSDLEVAEQSEASIALKQKPAVDGKKADAQASDTTEVVVTGTHIRGGNPTSPVHVVTRQDLDQSGYTQVGDFMRSLPENFAGGQNPGVLGADTSNVANHNLSNASTLNLRGLGSDATLVLIDGHRLSSDGFSQGSDITGIPMAAIQRIEIVTDGASALYGSDAVAGVVNFILRKDYSGGEVAGSVGTSADGGGTERQLSVLDGISGTNWYLLGDVESGSQDGIVASQRQLTNKVTPQTTLLEPQRHNSFYIRGGFDLSTATSISMDGLLRDRYSTQSTQVDAASAAYNFRNYVPSYNLALAVDHKIGGGWRFHLTGVVAGSRDELWTGIPAYAYEGDYAYKNDLRYAEATADGPLVHLPGGDLQVAVGAGYRTEGFQSGLNDDLSKTKVSRDVSYAFGEMLIPLVYPSADRPGLNSLDLSLSGRTEKYSDLGGATTPKVGFRYVPLPGLTVRGTWGKSFKAPSFQEMYQASPLYLYPANWLGYAGAGAAMVKAGGNPDLKPERSTSWTLGMDYVPAFAPQAKFTATWFDVDYTNRVVQPVPNLAVALSSALYAPFVSTSPSVQQQSGLISAASEFDNFTGGAYDPPSVVAVIDDAYTNATAQTLRGVDISWRQQLNLGASRAELFADGTWLNLDQRTIVTAPDTRLSGTIFNPPKFKAKAGLNWISHGWTSTGTVNFISSELDTGVSPAAAIGSWTTFDATVSYAFQKKSGLACGLKITASATNLLDRQPPRAISPGQSYAGLFYDSTNASVIGRFMSLTVSKDW